MTNDGQDGSGKLLAPPLVEPVEPRRSPPSFSVVIAAYQAETTIGAAVRSALEQVHPAKEIIVVDDGSTDDIEGALRPFRGGIELRRKSNGGVSSARNLGIESASGEFIALLDADDRFHPRRLEALSELASLRPDLDLLSTDMRFLVDGQETGRFYAANSFAVEDQPAAILRGCFVGGLPAARADRLRKVRGFDESLRIGGDWDCWLRMILDGSLAGLVDRPYYDYVLREGTLTSDRARSLWGRVRLLEKAVDNPGLSPDLEVVLASSIRRHRSRAVAAETDAVIDGKGLRGELARHVLSAGVPLRVRSLAALACISPSLARRAIGAGGAG